MSDVVIGRDIPSYHGVVAVSHYCSFCNTEIPPHICPKMQEAIESDNK